MSTYIGFRRSNSPLICFLILITAFVICAVLFTAPALRDMLKSSPAICVLNGTAQPDGSDATPTTKAKNSSVAPPVCSYNLTLYLKDPEKIKKIILDIIRSENENETRNSRDAVSPKLVLIVAYHRTGSTFLGEILSQYPSSFYHFEPLLARHQDRNGELPDRDLSLLTSLFNCSYDDPEYSNATRMNRYMLRYNRKFWKTCTTCEDLCFDRTVLESSCRIRRLNVMKVVRLRLRDAAKLLDRFPSLRVIHLIRDPRATYGSRRSLSWCGTNPCRNPDRMCESMRDDLSFFNTVIREKYPDRYVMIRHEDLATDPFGETEKMLKFLDLEPSDEITTYLKSHTNNKYRNYERHGTFRRSKTVPYGWLTNLNWPEVRMVQESCNDVIRSLGFEPLDDEESFNNRQIQYLNQIK